MKKVLWGTFFASLAGILLLAPQSNFANRVRELAYTLQDSLVAVWQTDPFSALTFFLIFVLFLVFFVLISQYNGNDKFSDEDIEYIKSKSPEELHLLQSRQNKNYLVIQLLAAIFFMLLGTFFGYFLAEIQI